MLQILYEQWIQVGGHWDKSQLVVQARTTIKGSKTGARRWMLRADIVQKYGSEEIADELIHAKESDPELRKTQVRDHPELPHRADLRLYLCWDSSVESDTEDVMVEQLLSAVQSDSHKRGRSEKKKASKKKDKKRRKRSTSSSRSSSQSSKSSSTSGQSTLSSVSAMSKVTKATKATKAKDKKKKSKSKGRKASEHAEQPPAPQLTKAQLAKLEKKRKQEETKEAQRKQKEEEKEAKRQTKEAENEQKRIKREAQQKVEKEKQAKRAEGKKATGKGRDRRWGVHGLCSAYRICRYMQYEK